MRATVLISVFAAGCMFPQYGSSDGETREPSPAPDMAASTAGSMAVPSDSALAEMLEGETYKSSAFTKVNRAAYPSTLAIGNDINVYVSAAAATEYEKISPEVTGSGVSLPIGTVIVREVLDAQGQLEKLTMMVKREPGYFAGGGDWMFAATTPYGVALEVDGGGQEWGALTTCGGCHEPRQNDGWLYGVTQSAR